MHDINEIKAAFRNGQHAEAIHACEQLCAQQPDHLELKKLYATLQGLVGNFSVSSSVLKEILATDESDGEVIFNIGVCERELHNYGDAQHYYGLYTQKFPKQWEGWVNLAECQFKLNALSNSLASVERAIALNPGAIQSWMAKGDTLQGLNRHAEALKCFEKANKIQPTAGAWLKQGLLLAAQNRHADALARIERAIKLDANLLAARTARADMLNVLGRTDEAIAEYKAILAIKPDDEDTLKKVSVCLANVQRSAEALQLCRNAIAANPDSLTAKLGLSWLIDKIVPNWHVPMMNEVERNTAYFEGMKAAITPDSHVFEIGAGSGLLSMMAARLGAKRVVTCEGASLIADMAQQIVDQNGFKDTVSVLAKPSFEVELEKDLPAKADVLVHEIFSSGLIEEHVLPALEDAKQRLLTPDACIIPGASSIMIALVGGDDLGRYLHVTDPFGFDIRAFNAITPKKLPIFREDLQLKLMSDDVEAFRFDFVNDDTYPSEQKTLTVTATEEGLCYGVIQWIRLEMDETTTYHNHPLEKRPVSGWQHLVYRFDEPLPVTPGMEVRLYAAHDRATPWFDLETAQADG